MHTYKAVLFNLQQGTGELKNVVATFKSNSHLIHISANAANAY